MFIVIICIIVNNLDNKINFKNTGRKH